MITELTPDQEKLLEEVRQEWIQLALGGDTSLDESTAREMVDWLYDQANLEAPKLKLFADSPLHSQCIANVLGQIEQVLPDWEKVDPRMLEEVGQELSLELLAKVKTMIKQ